MAALLSMSFFCGLRGYHVYQVNWTPTLGEILPTIHERDNAYDRYAIAARRRLPGQIVESTVGHLPKEISRITRFLILHGAVVTVKVIDVHHRRSPLVQGGLEIPIKVTVQMEYTSKNKAALTEYDSLVARYYKEPVDGKYEDITKNVLSSLDSDSSEAESGSDTEDDY